MMQTASRRNSSKTLVAERCSTREWWRAWTICEPGNVFSDSLLYALPQDIRDMRDVSVDTVNNAPVKFLKQVGDQPILYYYANDTSRNCFIEQVYSLCLGVPPRLSEDKLSIDGFILNNTTKNHRATALNVDSFFAKHETSQLKYKTFETAQYVGLLKSQSQRDERDQLKLS